MKTLYDSHCVNYYISKTRWSKNNFRISLAVNVKIAIYMHPYNFVDYIQKYIAIELNIFYLQ